MSFLTNYGLFLIKTITILAAIIAILMTIVALKLKAKSSEQGSLHIKKLNEKYDDMSEMINETIQSKTEKKALKATSKKEAKEKKSAAKKEDHKKRLFLIHFDGDIKASAVDDLRETITGILLTAKKEDTVLLCLESGGGIVNGYGLAASQLQRLRDAHIHLTVAIDKVAASGGYMMACVANEIIAAPFSIIGSIGVIAQLPNFHRLLEKNNIDFEQITAGQYKRTLTVFGKNTHEGREKLQVEINETHDLFKSFVKTNRESVNIDEVATGEHWFAAQCVEKKLVDKLQTSDDYLLSKKDEFDIYALEFKIKQPLSKRMNLFVQNSLHQLFAK
ncbi:MAG: protease SohB [Gammaproteobacteria bacterium CG_4_10_14_0_8_um_filter_38_16]|nr:MAG: protease SohB [Gammaproteobacteria bacterium CG_4_10_14_0_8_um_filter_38_16]PJA02715.1 MAG: protease SohB [Gammaproteobacteria bacterium CG_4_10_14_0_2_um_filter_38_22]PJB09793.1 MAG: protease SohB [Gammaproteobacteria bacterium CG_4_9_14_3_um_filter_38_9]